MTKTKIPLENLQGKTVTVVLKRGLGNGILSLRKHTGVLLEYDSKQLCIRSVHSKREIWMRRPCAPRDEVREEVKE